jgi:hypothetical protein
MRETNYLLVSGQDRVNNNTYRISLPNSVNLDDYEVAVGQGYVYYSWFNINSFPLNNNTFVLKVPGMADSTITIPDGAYNITDLNNYLQYWFIANGLYIINSTTLENYYYASFTVSPTNYKIQWTTATIPASIPAGFTVGGANMTAAFVNSNNLKQMQIVIASTNDFKNIIGFNDGTYPLLATGNVNPNTKESDYTPNVNPINGIQMRLSCVNNSFSSNNHLLYIFSNGQYSIGEQIDISPNELQFVHCRGTHKELTLTFYDQKGNRLEMLDSNILITLYFKKS